MLTRCTYTGRHNQIPTVTSWPGWWHGVERLFGTPPMPKGPWWTRQTPSLEQGSHFCCPFMWPCWLMGTDLQVRTLILFTTLFAPPKCTCVHKSILPLHRSESPSQVFIIVLRWLYETLQHIPPDKWGEVVVSYDNMCHLDRLKASQSPLPLPQPYNLMWRKVTKVPRPVACKKMDAFTTWLFCTQGKVELNEWQWYNSIQCSADRLLQ